MKEEKTAPLKCHSKYVFNNDSGDKFTHLELNISFQIVSNSVWSLGLVGVCVNMLKKGDGFAVGFGSLSVNVAKLNDDAPGFDSVVFEFCTEDDRVRLADISFTVPMDKNNDRDDDPNAAGIVPVTIDCSA